MAVRAW